MKRWVLVLAACGSPPRPAPSHHAPPAVAQVERGLDFERGRGVPRDYRRAAAVYRAACLDGCGELASCQRLFRLATADRGVVIEGRDLATLVGRLCDRHDVQACIASMLLGIRDETALIHREPEERLAACEAGDLGACQLVQFGASFNFSGSSAVEERAHRAASKACELGDLDGCIELVQNHPESEDDDRAARARTRVEMACHDGDADACKALDRDIPAAQLCDAGDYDACEKLAKDGDDHAKQIACAAGLDVGCAIKVPPRVAPRDYAQSLLFMRQQCTQVQNQQACDLLAKETAPRRCP